MMARFELTAPDGTRYEVEGPEGATEADAYSILQQQVGGGAQQAAPQTRSGRRRGVAPEPQPDPFEGRSWRQQMGDQWGNYKDAASQLGDIIQPAANVMQDVNTGMLGWVPGLRENTESLGNIVRPPGVEAEGYGGRAADAVGMGLGAYFGGGAALMGRAKAMGDVGMQAARQYMAQNPGAMSSIRNLGGQMRDFMVRRPVGAPALEAASGAGAGVGMEAGLDLADAFDLGPTGRVLSEQIGGLAGGFGVPAATGALSLSPARWAGGKIKNAFDDLVAIGAHAEQGPSRGSLAAWGPGGRRAAERVQSLVPDPEAAAAAVQRAPEGISPARATQDPDLMALENLRARRDPRFARDIEEGRLAATSHAETDFSDMFGPQRDQNTWRQQVMERASAPDSPPIGAGQTDEMLDAAYRTFGPAYKQVRAEGGTIPLRLKEGRGETLNELLTDAFSDPRVASGAVTKFERLMQPYTGEGGVLRTQASVDDLLNLRSAIRDEARRYGRSAATSGNVDTELTADAWRSAERAVTRILESNLDPALAQRLKNIDARYRAHKIVEDAAWRGGDKEITPEALQAAVKRSHGRGEFARGELETPASGILGEETSLLTMSRHGVDVAKIRGNPDYARRITRGMDGDQVTSLKSDFNNNLLESSKKGGVVSGRKLTELVDKERETMRALGYTAEDMANVDRVLANLRMVETMDYSQVQAFITDKPGHLLNFTAALLGSAVGRKAAQLAGGKMAQSLILAHAGAKIGREQAVALIQDNAARLVTDALADRELMRALLTRPTDTRAAQMEAGQRLHAWLVTLGDPATEGLRDAPAE
jgi:hypothetical protein